MSIILSALETTSRSFARRAVLPTLPQIALLVAIAGAFMAGLLVTGVDATTQAVANAGADLARLLRFMAALKAVMALCVAAVVYWRLGAAIRPMWLVAYLLACAATGAGPALIYGMAHVGLGALLLHGGLAASIVLLWRDRVVSKRLAERVRHRSLGRRRQIVIPPSES